MYALSYPSADKRVIPNTRHLNPAVTFALVASMKISFFNAMMYLVAQISGTGLGALVFYYCTPYTRTSITSTYPQLEKVNEFQETVMELITSYIFILVLMTTAFGHLKKQPSVADPLDEETPQSQHELVCVIAGTTIFMCAVVGGTKMKM